MNFNKDKIIRESFYKDCDDKVSVRGVVIGTKQNVH